MKLSVIIPVFNVAPYIESCLRSVMRQTYRGSMECLIVDDCSIDESTAIAERMIAEYEGPIQFLILHHDHNRGLSAARNTGTIQAQGDYLFYLDSDDEITEDCFEKLMSKVEEYPDIEMVTGNELKHFLDGSSKALITHITQPIATTNDEVRRCFYQYKQMTVHVYNKLIKRSIIIDNNILCKEGLIYEDTLWAFCLLKYISKTYFISDITYHYKKRPSSITTGTDKKTIARNLAIVYQDILMNLTLGHEQEEYYHYVRRIRRFYVRYVIDVRELEKTFLLLWDKSKLYGSKLSRLKLAVSYPLGKFKYGWGVWIIMKKLRHPSTIPGFFFRLTKDLPFAHWMKRSKGMGVW